MLPLIVSSLLTGCTPPVASVRLNPQSSKINEYYQTPEPEASWDVECGQVERLDCDAATGGIDVTLSADPSVALGFRLLDRRYQTPIGSGVQVLSHIHCWGCRVYVSMNFVCGYGLATSYSGSVKSAHVVIPPAVSEGDALSSQDHGPVLVSADAVPFEFPFKFSGGLDVHPWGDETATVRMVGPGIDFAGTYAHDPAQSSIAFDHSVGDAYRADPKAWVKASGPGTARVWVEYGGTRSREVVLTLIESPESPGTVGAGDDQVGDGDETSPHAGCSSVGFPHLLAAAGFWVRRRRRASHLGAPRST